jgi:integrase
VQVVGDKPIIELTQSDTITYSEWWRARVVEGEVAAKTANKDMGQLSRMLKDMNIRRRLDLPDLFKGLHLRGETDKSRLPYEPDFIQSRFLGGALAGLNEDARLVMYVMIETGLRLSEIVNLTENTIVLDAPIPHVRIWAEGRRLKTGDSEREIPLVGVALKALTLRPGGFPKYRDDANGVSATANKFMFENGLRPTRDHTVYSLRHSFRDRLVAVEAPDSLIDNLMGHKTYKPKYGKGPSLELKLKFLERMAFPVPDCL